MTLTIFHYVEEKIIWYRVPGINLVTSILFCYYTIINIF